MKKTKSSKRKSKRLKMDAINSLAMVFMLSCLGPCLAASLPGAEGDEANPGKLEERHPNITCKS